MTQDEIRAVHAEIEQRRDDLRIMERDLRNKQDDLIRRCKHPNKYDYTAMGDPGVKCPDCGYQT